MQSRAMSENAQAIWDAAVRLPEAERIRVLEGLLESLEPGRAQDEQEIAQAWKAEVLRRASELDSGTVKPVPWSEVQAAGERLFHAGD